MLFISKCTLMNTYLANLKIENGSPTPKYQQLIQAIETGLNNGQIVQHELLPSINSLSIVLDMGRNTVEKAYRKLQLKGLIDCVKGSRYTVL